jgi:hypothetical protein
MKEGRIHVHAVPWVWLKLAAVTSSKSTAVSSARITGASGMALGAAWTDSARRLATMGVMENFIVTRVLGMLELVDVVDENGRFKLSTLRTVDDGIFISIENKLPGCMYLQHRRHWKPSLHFFAQSRLLAPLSSLLSGEEPLEAS